MSQKLIKDTQDVLAYARIQDRHVPFLEPFLNACTNNSAARVLQLAPNCEAGLLTCGLNRAIDGGHIDLPHHLLGVGSTWDAETVNIASRSLEAVKLLVESGFDVNTGLIGGNMFLA